MSTPAEVEAEAGERFMTAHAGSRLALIADSFRRLTGRSLLGDTPWSAQAMWRAPVVVLAHGTEPDPLLFYGNRLGLELFEITPETLARTPSRFTAEPLEREERARLLDQVTRRGFIQDYAGVRVSANGRRFRIEQATVWNLVDDAGASHGQGATFAGWTPL